MINVPGISVRTPATRRGALRAADKLSLMAAPAFCGMAVWTGVIDTNPLAQLCSAAHASPIGGMAAMYLLMAAVHAAPWLRLLADQHHVPQRAS